MGKHGLVTWGPHSKTSYENTIRIIHQAEDYIADRKKGKKVFGELKIPGLSVSERQAIMAEVLPVIRGAVSSRKTAILHFFFQAEDGIRDGRVTGVQTCALPI